MKPDAFKFTVENKVINISDILYVPPFQDKKWNHRLLRNVATFLPSCMVSKPFTVTAGRETKISQKFVASLGAPTPRHQALDPRLVTLRNFRIPLDM